MRYRSVIPAIRLRRPSAASGTLVSSVSAAAAYTGLQAVGEDESLTSRSSATEGVRERWRGGGGGGGMKGERREIHVDINCEWFNHNYYYT